MLVFGIRSEGPVFDGRAAVAARQYCEEIEQVIAEVGVHKVRVRFASFVKHPTGYYDSKITAGPVFGGRWGVHDSGVVYGPWLAGVGSRNKTSRFKGYPHWQLASLDLRADANDIAEFVLQRYLPRMR